MTKTQPEHTKKVQKNTPLNTTRYHGFYLTMLILSTIGTTLGVIGLWGIIDTIEMFDRSPVYAVFSLINVLVVLPIAIWALILLWFKHPLGIWLKLSTYGASIICAIGLLLSASPIITFLSSEAITQVRTSSDQALSNSFIESITTIALYGGLVLSIVVSIVFGLLWYFAWKKQSKADSE